MRNFNVQMTVTVSCKELLEKLKENKIKHRNDFITAKANWILECQTRLTKQLFDFTKSDKPEDIALHVLQSCPKDMTEEYSQAIKMLEWNKNETMELDHQQFEALIMDNWSWKDAWSTSNSKYLGQ